MCRWRWENKTHQIVARKAAGGLVRRALLDVRQQRCNVHRLDFPQRLHAQCTSLGLCIEAWSSFAYPSGAHAKSRGFSPQALFVHRNIQVMGS